MKNTNKYDTPDLRHVVISRLVKNAEKAFENEQMIDLSEEELYNIMTKRPQVAGRKVMDVLIRWVKKSFALEDPKVEKKEEAIEERDSRNLIHFLKNTSKYDTPDLRNVVISKLLKDTEKAFENEQMIDKDAEKAFENEQMIDKDAEKAF